MVIWHQTFAAQIGLRALGAGILYGATLVGSTLYTQIHSHSPREASLTELAFCALFVLLLVIGNALLFVGPGLWKEVEIPGRWSAVLIEPKPFDLFLDAEVSKAVGTYEQRSDTPDRVACN